MKLRAPQVDAPTKTSAAMRMGWVAGPSRAIRGSAFLRVPVLRWCKKEIIAWRVGVKKETKRNPIIYENPRRISFSGPLKE